MNHEIGPADKILTCDEEMFIFFKLGGEKDDCSFFLSFGWRKKERKKHGKFLLLCFENKIRLIGKDELIIAIAFQVTFLPILGF